MGSIIEMPLSMPLLVPLTGRASVRDFKGDAIGKPQVDSLLQADVRAPKAMHQEA